MYTNSYKLKLAVMFTKHTKQNANFILLNMYVELSGAILNY